MRIPFFGCVPTNSCLCNGALVGSVEGIPADATARVGESIMYGIRWTVPDAESWHSLSTLDVRLTDEDAGYDILTVRWDELSNTFNRLKRNGKTGRSRLPGSAMGIASSAVTLLLENTEVVATGPTGPSVLLDLHLEFKPRAAGRIRVDVSATNDSGDTAGFGGTVGTITVQP